MKRVIHQDQERFILEMQSLVNILKSLKVIYHVNKKKRRKKNLKKIPIGETTYCFQNLASLKKILVCQP